MGRFFIATFTAAILLVTTARAQWIEVGGLNNLQASSYIRTVCSDPWGNIYAASTFDSTAEGYGVKKWNGQNWSLLGGPYSISANNTIYSLCSDAAGNIYAAGWFTNDSGNCYVAKWDGTGWTELGGFNTLHANNAINSICADSAGNIYAAGGFKNTSGKFYVAKYNGSTWSEVGGYNALAANSTIISICTDVSGNVYAAGYFTNGPISLLGNAYVAKYDGNAWTQLGGNTITFDGEILTICSDPAGNIYAAGEFAAADNRYFVAQYSDSGWNALGGPDSLYANDPIYSLCSDTAGNIYAAGDLSDPYGNIFVAQWNSAYNFWNNYGGPQSLAVNSFALSVCSSPAGNVYVAGEFSDSRGSYYVAGFPQLVYTNVADTICQGFPFILGTDTFAINGVYNDTLTGQPGIDTVVTLYLTVKPAPVVTLSWDSIIPYLAPPQNWGYCLGTEPPIPLRGGLPPGGLYYGQYVADDTLLNIPFNYTGYSSDTIFYSYTDSTTGCTAVATNIIYLGVCQGIALVADAPDLNIYPNPTTGQLIIETQNFNPKTITIYDDAGRRINTLPFKNELDISSLSSGVYFMEVKGEAGVVRKRVIKM